MYFGIVGNPNGSALSVTQAVTDSNGYASTILTLGDSLGTYTVVASNPLNPNRNVTFHATAIITGTASAMQLATGNNQPPAPILTSLSMFAVTVIDTSRNPVAGVPVQFRIDTIPVRATGQVLSDTNAYTDMSGQASTILTLGNKVGTYRVRAIAAGLTGSPIIFTARAIAGPPKTTSLVSGNNQVKQIGDTLNYPFVISVADTGVNPVDSAKVKFVVTSAPTGARNYNLTADSVFTDSLGYASVKLIVGTKPGYYVVTATVQGLQPDTCLARAFFLAGDVNRDEAVNVGDITNIVDHINGKRQLSELDSLRADIDNNGVIDINDITMIRSNILNEIISADSGSSFYKAGYTGKPQSKAGVLSTLEETITVGSAAQIQSISGALEVTQNGLRFNLSNDVPVTGVQLDARFKQDVHVEAPELVFARMHPMEIYVHSIGPKLHVVAYNLKNTPIDTAGANQNTTLLRFPLYWQSVAQIDTATVVVSTTDSQVISFGAMKVRALPGVTYPAYYRLYQNYPNPFNNSTTIRYEVPDLQGRFARVQIEIFNILGRQVKTLYLGDVEAGLHFVIWDGKDYSGKPMPSGIYFCRLIAREHLSVKKIIYIK